ncbi:hypothetical protein TRVA0_040S01090 [Trichomonascus vanleenenianus]|uniref:Scp1p n=1 Tax=Trichomonascus vanleenenianus TaxID=2268995 RepID=UPI003EC9C1E7
MPRPYDPESSVDVKEWIERVLEEQLPPGDVIDSLKDGVVLCRLVNALQPNSASFKKSSMPFVQMENIAAFLRACDKVFNVPHHELFETVDLYDGNDPVQVITTLRSLSRHAHEMNSSVPVLGPRLNTQKYERHFTKKANIPAWNTRQYGQIGISQGTEGVIMGGRRDIVGVQSKPSPKAPNIIVPNDPNRKPSKPPKPVNLKPSVFGEDNEEEEEQQRPAFGRGFYARQ